MKQHYFILLITILTLTCCQQRLEKRSKYDSSESSYDSLSIIIQPPEGRYAVGTISRSFTDISRREIAARDTTEFRTLYTQIWYPTDDTGNPAHYLGSPDRSEPFSKLEDSTWINRFNNVKTNAIANAKISSRLSKYPVVFFSGGFGLSKNYYTTFLEGLASNGYIVFGIDLPYVNPLVTEDGKAIGSNNSYWDSFPLTKGIDDYQEGKDKLEFTNKYFSSDYLFLFEELKKLNADTFFQEAMDLEHIASLGHSAGASPTMALMEIEDGPFDAFIIYDVTIHAHFASENLAFPIEVRSNSPILLFMLEYAWMPSQDFINSLDSEFSIISMRNTKHSSLADVEFIEYASTDDKEEMDLALHNINKIINHTVSFLDLNIRNKK